MEEGGGLTLGGAAMVAQAQWREAGGDDCVAAVEGGRRLSRVGHDGPS
jgi:hypothetical protein